MGLSVFLSKYLLVFLGFGSAASVPLIYSQGGSLTSARGGNFSNKEQDNSFNVVEKSATSDLFDFSHVEEMREQKDLQVSQDSSLLQVNSIKEPSQLSLGVVDSLKKVDFDLKVDHDLPKKYQRVVSYEKFRNIYGTKGFKEEGNINLKGGENMTILDAWEKFFKVGDSFFLGDGKGSLPFWNYDFPYIAVEFPKEIQLSKELLDKGWIKVGDDSSLEGQDYKGLKEAVSLVKKIQSSEGSERENYIKDKTLNRIMFPSSDANLYLVTSPEKLLRLWLQDWNSISMKNDVLTSYSLFEASHYEKSVDHPEVSILRRWWNGKSYRMWIHHKELKSESISINKKDLGIIYYSKTDKKPKYLKLDLQWSKNFLLNLLIWYSYSYKLGSDPLSFSQSNQEGGWNLINIYKQNGEINYDDFSKWIKDWYKGTGRDEWVYWWNLAILGGRKFNRVERINWIGDTMNKLSENWGSLSESNRVVS